MRTHIHYLTVLAAFVALTSLPAIAFAQDAKAPSEKEQQFIATLASADAPGADKALACKGLAVHGTSAAVPELAKLLGDEKLSSWARIALEAIPGAAADAALRDAVETVGGLQRVGVINSVGVRRDKEAVAALRKWLEGDDIEPANAAAVALGRIGTDEATKLLRDSLKTVRKEVQSAVAEGCILCAEQRLAAGNGQEAAEIYDQVRAAELPRQRVIEATRGAILARGDEGIPLLVEQLQSPDKWLFQTGLTVARELPGKKASEAIAEELAEAKPERAALILLALGDRNDTAILPAVIAAARQENKEVRLAAMGVMGRLGDASTVPALLAMAVDADKELSEGAKTALAGLSGDKVNAEIAARLDKASARELPILIDVVGQRRIEATPALVKALDSSDAAVRASALAALGETIPAEKLSVLIAQAVSPTKAADGPAAMKALRAAAVRMPDREATAAQLVAAMSKGSTATKNSLLEILGEMGGQKALDALVAAVKSSDDELRDTSSELLGKWMSTDAAPQLLTLAKTAPTDKYKLRSLRAYIRLARQFTMEDAERAAMCRNALAAATRDDERQLVLVVIERYPSLEMLQVAVDNAKVLKDDVTRPALVVAQKIEQKEEAAKLLQKLGIERMKIEIVKATYGAGSTQKDVTEIVKKRTGDYPVIVLPNATYTASFGGDPLPGTPKQLKISYKIDGKAGEVSLAENAPVVLPVPK